MGRVPYSVAKEKEVRDVFRRFMAQFPAAYDYGAAQIPSPLTETMEKERKEKIAERKRAQRKARKQREKVGSDMTLDYILRGNCLTLYPPVTIFHKPIRIYMGSLILGINTLYMLLWF